MAREWGTTVAALLVVLIQTGTATAQDDVLCVSQSGSISGCVFQTGCTEVVSTFDDAMVSAGEIIAANGPRHIAICMDSEPLLTRRFVIDNSGNAFGSPLELGFGGSVICPDSSDEPGSATIEITPGDADLLRRVELSFGDGGDCPSDPRPGVDVLGPGTVYIAGRLRGTVGYGIRSGSNSTLGETFIGWTQVRDCIGPAVLAGRSTTLLNTQVLNCSVDQGAVLQGLGDAELTIQSSLIAANRAAQGADGVISGNLFGFDNSALALNAVEPGVPLLRSSTWSPVWTLEQGLLHSPGSEISHSWFSRNAVVDNIDTLPLQPPPTTLAPSPGSESCIDVGLEAWLESSAGLPGTSSGSPLFVFTEATSEQFISFQRSTFVENHSGTAPLIELEGSWGGLDLQFLQNTFAENTATSLVDATSLGAKARVALMRNLFSGADPPGALVNFDNPLLGLFAAGNVADPSVAWTSPGVGAQYDIESNVDAAAPLWRDEADVAAMSPCAKHLLMCPGQTILDCQARQANLAMHCPIDRARSRIPTDAWVANLGEPWPWDTTFFEASAPGWERPGAAGWRCENIRPAVDSLDWLGYGDGDGYPDALDCDNDSASWVPSVPDNEGGEWCVQVGSSPDDDDSGDDDDASGDDDVDAGDDDGGGDGSRPELTVPTGCSGRGCGTALPVRAGTLLLPGFVFGWRRRIRDA